MRQLPLAYLDNCNNVSKTRRISSKNLKEDIGSLFWWMWNTMHYNLRRGHSPTSWMESLIGVFTISIHCGNSSPVMCLYL